MRKIKIGDLQVVKLDGPFCLMKPKWCPLENKHCWAEWTGNKMDDDMSMALCKHYIESTEDNDGEACNYA